MTKWRAIFDKKKNQRGFLAAPVLFGMVASFAAITLAGSYVGVFDKLIEQQKNVQARNKMQQLASVIAESNLDQNGIMRVAPAMSLTAGGAAMTDGQTPHAELGGKLPTGYSTNTKFGEIAYFAFIHMPRTTDTAPPGYYVSGSGGIPNPDEMSFALVLPGVDGNLDTVKNDVTQGITRGDDIGIFKTVKDVNPGAYKSLIENAGNIPTCGIITETDGSRKHQNLQWNIDNKKWECVDSGIPAFLWRGDAEHGLEDLPVCPVHTALTLKLYGEGTENERQELICMSTVAPRPRSDYGLIYDENENIASLIDGDMASASPCPEGNTTLFRWTGTQRFCDDVPFTPSVTSCPAGQWLAMALSRFTSCYPFNAESLIRNGAVGARQQCAGGITPYYANGRTFCPEDGAPGGVKICKYGFDVAFVGSMQGFGCYILNDPILAGDQGEAAAVHYETETDDDSDEIEYCNENPGHVLQVQADDRVFVKCVNIFDALSFALPAASCPDIGGKRGALTFTTVPTRHFTCTAVD